MPRLTGLEQLGSFSYCAADWCMPSSCTGRLPSVSQIRGWGGDAGFLVSRITATLLPVLPPRGFCLLIGHLFLSGHPRSGFRAHPNSTHRSSFFLCIPSYLSTYEHVFVTSESVHTIMCRCTESSKSVELPNVHIPS